MDTKVFAASSKWFSSMVALLVALGTKTLLDNIIPASIADLPFISSPRTSHVAGEMSLVSAAAIQFLSFAMGGAVAVLLARGLSRGLVALLRGVAILATVFEQFPGRNPLALLAVWSIAGPAGIIAGAWAANARRAAA